MRSPGWRGHLPADRRTRLPRVVLDAANPAGPTRLQQIIGGNIERFAARDNLTVQWHSD